MSGEESEKLGDALGDALGEAIRAAIRDGMRHSPSVRRLLLELARVVVAEADRLETPRPGDEPAISEGAIVEPTHGPTAHEARSQHGELAATESASPPAAQPERVPLERLRLGGAATSGSGSLAPPRISGPRPPASVREAPAAPAGNEIDLGLIAKRCRLKGESCRFFIERRAHGGDPSRDPEYAGRINAMIATAKSLPSCFLWVFWKEAMQPEDDELRQIAACYDALGDAAALCQRAIEPGGGLDGDEVESAFALLAEASSAMRVAIGWTWLSSPDVDQDESHLWLRSETASRMIYVRRHMMLDDPADPARAEWLREDAARIAGNADRRRQHDKQIEALLNKARYHAKRLVDAPEPDEHDCAKVNQSIGELGALGVRASDARIVAVRELVEATEFPESAPKHAWLVARRDERGEAVEDDAGEDDGRAWSERVLSVRELLRGGRVVIVGGEPRQRAIDRIEEAFELEGIDWVYLSEHGTSSGMEAPIHREQARLVLVLIKLTGHLHAEQAREMASEAGKPCVMMPAGYNPEQIAAQVLRQADERLEQAASAGGGG